MTDATFHRPGGGRGWLLAALLAVGATAWGLINPNFTPIHLADQSDSIAAVRADAPGEADAVQLKLHRPLKGSPPATVRLALTSATPQHAKAARGLLAGSAGRDMLLFVSKPGAKHAAYLHVGGKWLRLAPTAGGWQLDAVDGDMAGVWNGATDMLARCVQYVLAEGPRADVPVQAGTTWREVVKVGAVGAQASGMSAVDLRGDGAACLHVACPAGDGLFRYDAKAEAFADAAPGLRLAARSLACAWGDFNADGRADLASWDGKTLTVWHQSAEGTFAATAPAAAAPIPSLASIAQGKRSVLVVGGRIPPLILGPGAAALPVGKDDAAALGKPGCPLAADFTGDGVADILLPCAKDGLLYAGRAGGGFDAPIRCGVDNAGGDGGADVGDFDADGRLDVLVAAADGVKLFHNRPDGTFQEAMGLSGEISYKAQPRASGCGVGDFNNDCRLDLFVTYARGGPLVYFNRGFRSYGEAPRLEAALTEVASLGAGQSTGVLADLDGDGAEDLALAGQDGSVFCALNDLGGEDLLWIRVGLASGAATPGPVTVTAWAGGRCLGARPVRVGGRPAIFGLARKGAYVVKWRLPGGPEQSRTLVVTGKGVDVRIGAEMEK